MSGGEFNHVQFGWGDIVDQIENESKRYTDKKITKRFKKTADTLRLAAKMVQRVDWLISCDDGEDCFLRRWDEEGCGEVE